MVILYLLALAAQKPFTVLGFDLLITAISWCKQRTLQTTKNGCTVTPWGRFSVILQYSVKLQGNCKKLKKKKKKQQWQPFAQAFEQHRALLLGQIRGYFAKAVPQALAWQYRGCLAARRKRSRVIWAGMDGLGMQYFWLCGSQMYGWFSMQLLECIELPISKAEIFLG